MSSTKPTTNNLNAPHHTHTPLAPLVNHSAVAESRVLAERRCSFGKLAYEKTTGFELIRARPTRLFSDRDGGIIGDCGRACEQDSSCKGFNMDYNRNECQAVTKNSENNLFNLRKSPGVSYFEAICLRGIIILNCRDCERRFNVV